MPEGALKSERTMNIGVMSIGPSEDVFREMVAKLHSFDNRKRKPDNHDQVGLPLRERTEDGRQGCPPDAGQLPFGLRLAVCLPLLRQRAQFRNFEDQASPFLAV
mmetsp:Transcript_136045/g.379166  ORF Transcript_136045/g.379166 Transcript_136045/m.379166 type:complete len:104 (-) Transcript_136045:206-517(-)